jgi:hypothetical protein
MDGSLGLVGGRNAGPSIAGEIASRGLKDGNEPERILRATGGYGQGYPHCPASLDAVSEQQA